MFSSQWRSSRNSCLAAPFSPARSTPSGSSWQRSQKSAFAATSSHSMKKPAQRCSSQARATAVAQLEPSRSSWANWLLPWRSDGSPEEPSHTSVSDPRPLSAWPWLWLGEGPTDSSREPSSELGRSGGEVTGSRSERCLRRSLASSIRGVSSGVWWKGGAVGLAREQAEGEKVTWWLVGAPGGLAEVDKDGALGDVQRKGGLRLRRWRL